MWIVAIWKYEFICSATEACTDHLFFNFQRHLSDTEFEAIFQMSRSDFYRVPAWKRNELKKRFRLF